jgi:hypothetical protein
VIIWHVLAETTAYRDLGSDYFTRRIDSPEVRKRRLIRELEALGHKVTIEPAADALPLSRRQPLSCELQLGGECSGMCTRSAMTLAAVVAFAVSGCSSDAAGARDAESIVEEIAQRVPSAHETVVITAANDPDNLLGRPAAYTSKTEFIDTRLDQGAEVMGGVPAGGSVEVFADGSKVKTRRDYLREAAKAESLAPEYDYVSGPILLRLSPNLSSDQAAEYETALSEIVRR